MRDVNMSVRAPLHAGRQRRTEGQAWEQMQTKNPISNRVPPHEGGQFRLEPDPRPALGGTPGVFSRDRLEMIRTIEDGHFWFQPRDTILDRTLALHRGPPATVLDVGCGSGRWLGRLRGLGYRVCGTDIWPEPPAGLAGDEYAEGTAEALPWPDASCDVLTLLDTLEHVADLPALQEAFRVLRPNGVLLVSVPAFPSLWSERDTRAGHHRRYTRQSLRAVLREAGFEVRRIFGFQFLLLPLFWVSRRLAARRPAQLTAEEKPAWWLNRVLTTINTFEVWAGSAWRPPVGSSLIAVGIKSSA